MIHTRAAAVALSCAVACAACGGGSSPTSPTSSPPPTIPVSNACGTVGIGIVNGAPCSTAASPVVLVNLRGSDGLPTGACSGTVIAPRAVLTAAHCLAGVASVRIYLGTGSEIPARAFSAYPGYRENDPSALDAGVVLMADDIGRTPVPLLLSRDAHVGETAIIVGWGKDQNLIPATLRAGSTTISAVTATQVQTEYSATASSVCSGDSGGPLLVQEGGAWAVAGITSAVTTTACNVGTNYFANVRNPSITSFILGLVPDAARR